MNYQILYDYYEKELQKTLSYKRFEHSLNVVETAFKISEFFSIEKDRVALAALVHDRGKEISNKRLLSIAKEQNLIYDESEEIYPELLHGPIGAYLLEYDNKIRDEKILNSVRYHTTGRPNMSQLEIIIFLADLVEPNRSYPRVDDLRKLVFNEPYEALLKSLDWTLEYLMRTGKVIHPLTVKTRNHYLNKV
ncbi:bis(5'-nucleosyl)-tetraphosphatase (symmetrical) YqeK [Natranaerobius trueperi]|uniref:bis(5'-nucleosyl)-tetraphosphatase (symmetrical) n=1 Tax=Natranaerobius trueperi TaxID=759412 RepID=A0A226C016_9FIRM|nr:bis(5'-nucleosyl)-tetraphosphatase (symmetrical) YqeK [Natranaerobius trueperi]OWZ83934.1 phosphohydrolase [Natranaerobius trueperi]